MVDITIPGNYGYVRAVSPSPCSLFPPQSYSHSHNYIRYR